MVQGAPQVMKASAGTQGVLLGDIFFCSWPCQGQYDWEFILVHKDATYSLRSAIFAERAGRRQAGRSLQGGLGGPT